MAVIIIILKEDGLSKEQILGTTDSENFWSDMKRSMKTIFALVCWVVAFLFTEG